MVETHILYARWRKQVHENCLVYERPREAHFCWLEKNDIVQLQWPGLPTLYGCLRCMRSHVCHHPDYATCPRIPSFGDTGAYVCPFSGTVITATNAAAMTHNGSFDIRARIVGQMRDHRPSLAYAHNDVDDDDTTTQGTRGYGFSIGVREARRLRAGANSAVTSATRNRMFKAADVATERSRAREATKRYEKFAASYAISTTTTTTGRTGGGNTQKHHSKRRRLNPPPSDVPLATTVAGVDAEDRDEGGGGGGDDVAATTMADTLMPPWQHEHVVIPTEELDADDAYLATYFAPVMQRVATLPSPVITSVTTPAPPPSTSSTAIPVMPTQPRLVLLCAPPMRVDYTSRDVPWKVLDMYTGMSGFLPHQRQLHAHIEKYLAAVRTHACLRGKRAPDAQRYAVFCDRLLWLYHRYKTSEECTPRLVGDTHFINGSGPMWPIDDSRVARTVFILLTGVLAVEGACRDPLTKGNVFVWVADPWLLACRQHQLFEQVPPRTLGLKEFPKPNYCRKQQEKMVDALKYAPFAPHVLHAFLHPPSADGNDDADGQ